MCADSPGPPVQLHHAQVVLGADLAVQVAPQPEAAGLAEPARAPGVRGGEDRAGLRPGGGPAGA
eukprot:1430621-Pyramimonas_sp.AAC.1